MKRGGQEWTKFLFSCNILPFVPSGTIETNVPTMAIFADEFDRGRSYRTRRPQGSGDSAVDLYRGGGMGLPELLRTRPGDLLLYDPDVFTGLRAIAEVGKWRLRWAHLPPRPFWHGWLRWPRSARAFTWCIFADCGAGSTWMRSGRMIRASRRPGAIQPNWRFRPGGGRVVRPGRGRRRGGYSVMARQMNAPRRC